jgi:hypothetical protein
MKIEAVYSSETTITMEIEAVGSTERTFILKRGRRFHRNDVYPEN